MTLSMKLVIDKKTQRLLFAEASKEVVDFLFSFLAITLATAVKLLEKDAVLGSVGNLYSSVDKLGATYVQAGATKDALLSPTVLSFGNSLLGLRDQRTLYVCTVAPTRSNCHSYVTAVYGESCPSCYYGTMTTAAPAQLVPAAVTAAKGFVQGIVTYVVTDNLTVTPMSAGSSITLLSTFGVRDLADLQEKTVQLYNEGLAILKASLQSKTVLTDVFLGDKKVNEGRA
ncbi:unnamed protein product [Urochloa humidicola]